VMKESTPKLDGLVEHIVSDFDVEEVVSLPPVLSVDPVLSFDPVLSVDPVLSFDPVLSLDPVLSFDPVLSLDPVWNVDPVLSLDEQEVDLTLEVDVGLPKRVVSNDNIKTFMLDSPYEAMSLKELKEKVAEINGPKLKTKKELMEYLKNKK